MLHALGSEVTVIEALPELLAGMDPDFVSLVAAGIDPAIDVLLSSAVTAVTRQAGGELTVRFKGGATEDSFDADLVLMAVGRRPVIPEGASGLGLSMDGHGLAVEPSMQIPGHPYLYASGDVNGRSMLFHSAVRQSLVAAHNILAGNRVVDRMDFDTVPATIFTAPEGSYVGLTRATAAERHVEIVEGAYALADDLRAQIVGETYGEIACSSRPGACASSEAGSSGSTPSSSSGRSVRRRRQASAPTTSPASPISTPPLQKASERQPEPS